LILDVLSKYVTNWLTNEINDEDLRRPTVIFSPHPDDETLSCGGTIIKKKRVGADVKIIFMTSGEKSHRGLIQEEKLAEVRRNEALFACRTLGLTDADVFFLKFKDTELNQYQESATQKVKEIILFQQPDEIFVPYCEWPPLWSLDHLTTNRIVSTALQACKKKVTVYQYPVWLWYDLPWLNKLNDAPKQLLVALKQRLVSRYNLLRDFRFSVDIRDVLEIKRTALNHYKSQVSRLIPDPQWGTLADLSNGGFLECFFQEHEIFSVKTTLPCL
jgi:LmbE family N-acetylglucosaminyl deacetylase